ncbi:DUF6270 domain-containing protein [Pseudomonas sp. 17391]|uniref:DUF6270 domain-containing protein n=1 Tax=Pseudomonas sp. 17391 TaxID=2967217 RepID=UPI0023646015|nr:DUF6270 domain-containing protein [Pseudomonas sp. 17391]MDD2129117.1 DUF6270 domain-containing protein [Pseudomonas sp. 17391]
MTKNLIIYGSCVSRDIFNLEESRDFNLLEYYARSSMASLCSEAYENSEALEKIPSAFRRRMVAYDFSKEILSEKNQFDDADIILVDLIDERFDLILLPSGQTVTYSNELTESGILEDTSIEGFKIIPQDSMERRRLWFQGMQKFLALLKERNKLDRVLINKVFWSSAFEKTSETSFPVASTFIEKANAELAWMYEVLSHELANHQFLEFAPSLLTADEFHRWGASPFHYCEGYYKEALSQIKQKSATLNAVSEVPRTPRPYTPFVSKGAKLTVAGIKADGEIFAHCSLVTEGKLHDSGSFAFYLVVDGVRRDVRWYDASQNARFVAPETYKTLEVMAFYKDIFEEQLSAKCAVESI